MTTPTPQQAQADYCLTNGLPHFAPLDGWCFNCNQYIYAPGQSPSGHPTAGIAPEQAGTSHVKSCPHCSTSYCD